MKKDISIVKDSVSGLDQQTSTSVEEYSKKNEQQVQVIISNMDKAKLMVEEMQQKLSTVDELCNKISVDSELDYFKTVSKETSEKLKNLEIAFTLKLNTLERSIKNIPKSITKDDVQAMIDKSIAQLLEGLRPTPIEENIVTLEKLEGNQEHILSIPVHQQVNGTNELNEIVGDASNEIAKELEIPMETPVDVVIQSIEPVAVSETKQKRKKTTKKTK